VLELLPCDASVRLCGNGADRHGSPAGRISAEDRQQAGLVVEAAELGFVEGSFELLRLGGGDVDEGAGDCRDGDPVVLGDLVELQRLRMEFDAVVVVSLSRSRDVDGTARREDLPQRGRRAVAENCVLTAGEYRGHPAAPLRQPFVTDGVDALVYAMQAARPHAAMDRLRTEA
jgi:hypothetical protein